MGNNEITFSSSLKEAHRIGIPEAYPTYYISGYDTDTKLLILSNILMNLDLKLEYISIKGIENIDIKNVIFAKNDNMRSKLVESGVRNDDKLSSEAVLKLVDEDNTLYSINKKTKELNIWQILLVN